jgi:Cys-tRNA(Pro)/Cys-tRNA(Cys) deacylase
MARPAAAKTQAMRVLDARGIAYDVTVYDDSGVFHSGAEAAALLGAPAERVYKTLVVLRDGSRTRPMIVMVPAASTVDLRVLAQSVGEKRVRMATRREAESLTGMQAGGISVLGLRRPEAFDVYIDERVRELETISISGGRRGIELRLATEDLVALSGARFARTTAPADRGQSS